LLSGDSEQEVDVPRKLTKNFKFTGSDIYVEAQIENLMPQPLMVERLTWEPGPLIKVTDLNSLVDWTR
ncbi:Trafficking protein particle complex subunit 13, partial [Taenia solium]